MGSDTICMSMPFWLAIAYNDTIRLQSQKLKIVHVRQVICMQLLEKPWHVLVIDIFDCVIIVHKEHGFISIT